MFKKYTEKAKRAIMIAQEEAINLNHDYIGTEHILIGLLKEEEGVAYQVLKELGVDADKVVEEIDRIVGKGEYQQVGEISFTPRSKKVLELASQEASQLKHNYIGTEHILLGLIKEGSGVAVRILTDLGINLNNVYSRIMKILMENETQSFSPEVGKKTIKTLTLDEFGRDLTKLAREDKLDPVIGRSMEIQRVIQILSRRKKNNPCIIGEAGVGKTAIVEGLAQKIANNDIPEILKNKRIVCLDLALIVAGTKYRGEFEKRLKKIVSEVQESNEVILFIDEIHTLVGAGAAEGAIDASNILKPTLARGELQVIGATTSDEYRKYIEKDAALERRFQPIYISEPSIEETIDILQGLRPKYEAHHKIKINDQALEAAARLSARYVSGRFLPDKAIDLVDEAASRIKLQNTISPPDMKKVEIQLNKIIKEKESTIKLQEFEKAAQLRDKEKKLETELQKMKEKWETGRKINKVEVTEEDIAEIVSSWTGIPVFSLKEEETQKLLRMEDELHKRIIGQDEALISISKAIRRARAGMKNPKRPIGSFIFLGPTGVGKTELARSLAEFLFGDENSMISLDMSEYMEKFAVSRLVGAPPGYVGYEEGGQLTEKVRRKPYAVILLDEIEKAHPDVFNILLQIFEDGRLTDSQGRVVDFKNTVIIMTSNIGATLIRKGATLGFRGTNESEEMPYKEIKDNVMGELNKTFRPEFLNRIDEVIVFKSLTKEEIKKIAGLMLNDVKKLLEDQKIDFETVEEAKELLVKEGYNPNFGARPLRRTIERLIENPISEKILAGEFKEGECITIGAKDGKITFSKKGKKTKS
ncbi:MAG: ATP-dependent Clp protease ATP-binding subunit ClpC [Candidatus Infernicultor aquiphilus]|uniref:ATP-dependent Clp protease ATP-binding subunit ClpC n=1 Tax=Candidatus Infernicultor aquiphilus TaxID=1805029 RepID=A0A1J5H248_9BACT|nr:MAG: ATP-dependent Clp protease ATP-binding subunit ClpC [Candidatus Atribacteria bacterium CG2_30_33_13]PIW11203.1 MAG: ATP-dependent Clp protease ATP-binding subunit ClpC [Candidatus Atribacteria bacterium CG17_big_fil_post_rev_8_21_14_2_50_34_11]PIX33757.1 MAG: ATP-dependent Clp protease ATP-binding subunit ClpC [Candidatus Atribacteria bacterium CG_4_8_14_3_um_filter_34_18]PIY31036.1 MAG: ATP-dependent Clp protease ATP-binding subunit ClpC [Candidatus Atribacteria bacterium CG_4_10_14_3_u